MSILSCLTPKNDVDYVTDDASLFKTLQVMQNRNYTAIPIINKNGKYVGTITAGDILGCIKENFDLSIKASADFPVKNVNRIRDNKAVSVSAKTMEIIELSMNENFVPVVDDEENFIGIITRREILNWLKKEYIDKDGSEK